MMTASEMREKASVTGMHVLTTVEGIESRPIGCSYLFDDYETERRHRIRREEREKRRAKKRRRERAQARAQRRALEGMHSVTAMKAVLR